MTSPGFPAERPRAGLDVFKAHGLGNDYLVVEPGTAWTLEAPAVRAVCHRTRGAGSDGVIWVDPEAAPFASRMFNPDGSEFERSGNGLRILAAHLHRSGRVGGEPFTVVVGGEAVTLQVLGAEGGCYDVAVEMGRARVGPEAAALAPARLSPTRLAPARLAPAEDVPAQGTLDTGEGVVSLTPVSVGNPHAVLWGDPEPWRWTELDAPEAVAALHRYGPAVATDPGFAGGTNVQLARVASESRLHALVWERGVGRTSASGTSACAVAVAAVSSGRVAPGELEVVMEGGILGVRVGADLEVRLRGPVESVLEGRLAPGLVTG